MKDVVAQAILDRDRRIEGLGLGADVVFPEDPAASSAPGPRTKPRPVLALVDGECGDDLFERAAGDDQLAVGQDRRGEEDIDRMSAGEILGPRVELPALRSVGPVQRIEPAADVAEVDRVISRPAPSP